MVAASATQRTANHRLQNLHDQQESEEADTDSKCDSYSDERAGVSEKSEQQSSHVYLQCLRFNYSIMPRYYNINSWPQQC